MRGRYPLPSSFRFRRLAWTARLTLFGLICCLSALAGAQEEPGQPPVPDQPPPEGPTETVNVGNGSGPAELVPLANAARATVHGVVQNAATGEPLARALVRIEGDAVTGALTDGEGRFEIAGVPLGPQAFQVMKPGFIDEIAGGAGGPPTVVNGASNSEHNVYVASDMPELAFRLAPTNAIRGQVELSTGDAAQGIVVMLLRRAVQDGRGIWQPITNARTNSEGAYRFAGLTDGTYSVFTESTMDSELPAAFVEAGSEPAVTRAGYPTVFYPDAADLGGAMKIPVAAGQEAQANLLLTEQPFHLVRASVIPPRGANAPNASGGVPTNVNVMVLDAQGRQLSYGGQYDEATRSVQVFLPDGTYVLQVTAVDAIGGSFNGPRPAVVRGRPFENRAQGQLIGRVEFSVAGRAITHLQIPLTTQRSNPIQVSVIRSDLAQQTANSGGQEPPIVVMLSQASGSISDGMVTSYAEGYATGALESSPDIGPGSYYVHLNIPQKTLCEASFMAGAASLAREPLAIALSGATAPLMLTLREDCASLRLSLPQNGDLQEAGDEPNYTVYVVPDFDSTTDITPVVLRPSSGGMAMLDGLTPGSYHVYTFRSPVQLEYRNPEAMAALSNHAQIVTVDPGVSASLVVQVPEH